MGTFKRKELFKTVRIVEIDGKLDEIESTEKTQPLLDRLEKAGVVVDMGFKIKFVPQPCPICEKLIHRAWVMDQNDLVVEVQLFCRNCHWTEEMPK